MYGPKWPFLLMYMSHDMRHIFRRLTGGQRDTPGLGRHRFLYKSTRTNRIIIITLFQQVFRLIKYWKVVTSTTGEYVSS